MQPGTPGRIRIHPVTGLPPVSQNYYARPSPIIGSSARIGRLFPTVGVPFNTMRNFKLSLSPTFGIAVFTSVALIAPATAATTAAAPPATITGATSAGPGAAANAVSAKVPVWPSVALLMPPFLQAPATQTTDQLEPLIKERLKRRITRAPLGRNVSMRVEDLASGRRIYGKGARHGMIPASNMKLATALAALSAYGKDHVLPTIVSKAPGSRKIVITGGGDPLLSSADIDTLAQITAERALAEGFPYGKLVVRYDTSLFAPATLPSAWPHHYFYVHAAKPTALSRDRLMVAKPAENAAVYFRQRLRAHGLKGHVKTPVKRGTAPEGSAELASNTSHTVGDALWRLLLYSDNSIAEVMVRHVAVSRDMPTTPIGSAQALRAELADLGVRLKNASFHDGSGLSRSNRLPGKTLTSIVRASMDPDRPDLSSPYRWSSVPLAGRSGTLRYRFHAKRTRCAIGLVMAKTGTLHDVVSLSGVAVGTDGKHRTFSIVVNDRPKKYSLTSARYHVDRLAATLTGCV